MNYRDIIREMESSGRYSESDDLKRSMERNCISEYDRVYSRSDARDGLSIMSYAGDMAERAYDDLKYAERREQERQEEDEQRRELQQRQVEQEMQAELEKHDNPADAMLKEREK